MSNLCSAIGMLKKIKQEVVFFFSLLFFLTSNFNIIGRPLVKKEKSNDYCMRENNHCAKVFFLSQRLRYSKTKEESGSSILPNSVITSDMKIS